MGFPLNGIAYLLNTWEELKARNPHAFYLFLLFTQEHREFAQFFEHNFEKLDRDSGHQIMFFAIAPPPQGWLEQAAKRDYWKHYVANSGRGIGYDEEAVRQAARHFNLPFENLPAVVLFKDLEQADLITIQFFNQTQDSLADYFRRLFTTLKRPDVLDLPLSELRARIDLRTGGYSDNRLNREYMSRRDSVEWAEADQWEPEPGVLYSRIIPLPSSNIAFIQQDQNVLQKLDTILARLERLERGQRAGFGRVERQLSEIRILIQKTSADVATFREKFILDDSLLEAQVKTPVALAKARTALHAEFDEYLERQSQQLAEQLRHSRRPSLPTTLSQFKGTLEEHSRIALMTAEMLWQYLEEAKQPDPTDYAVCGIGLWKALEVEINRAFIDALRVCHSLTKPGTPSRMQAAPVGMVDIKEKGLFGGKRKDVVINTVRDGRFAGLELGKVAGLLINAPGNSLAAVGKSAPLILPAAYATSEQLLVELGQQVSEVAFRYRNAYAHQQPMKREVCEAFRAFVLEDQPPQTPLHATLKCKAELLQAGSI